MKKLLLNFICILLSFITNAQFSLNNKIKENIVIETPKEKSPDYPDWVTTKKDTIIKGKFIKSKTNTDSLIYDTIIKYSLNKEKVIDKITKEIDSILHVYYQRRLFVLGSDKIENKETLINQLNKQRDSIVAERDYRIRKIEYWEKYDAIEEIKNHREDKKYQRRNFFPAYYSSQAIRFFENDTTHVKLFQNNLVNYNPKSKKMTLYTEAVNDYLGPLRVAIGFQIESESKIDSSSTRDSTIKMEKKADMIAAIQNGGGDFSVNFKLPLIKTSNKDALIQSKFYFYGNTGFSLPVLNKASTDFIFNYDFGLEGAIYAKGFNERLTFYAQLKAGYFNGNNKFKKLITDANKDDPTSFGIFESSLGFDFLDGYRIRVDLFHGNSFVKDNFPATITFIVRPGKNK